MNQSGSMTFSIDPHTEENRPNPSSGCGWTCTSPLSVYFMHIVIMATNTIRRT